METSLHRQLKEAYATGDAQTEVRLGRFRIDVVREGRLIEIQHGQLASIRRKIAALLEEHRVTVVKPIVATKRIVFRKRRGGKIVRERLSPSAAHCSMRFTICCTSRGYFHINGWRSN